MSGLDKKGLEAAKRAMKTASDDNAVQGKFAPPRVDIFEAGLKAYLAALPSPTPEWRPIETAPKGTEHPYSNLLNSAEFVLVWNGHHCGAAYLTWDDYDSLHRWYDDGSEPVMPEPTHWQPLPLPPLPLNQGDET